MTKEEFYRQGMQQFSGDDLEGAIATFGKALEIDPDYADVLQALSMCYYHAKDYARAVEIGKRFQAADPDNPLAYTSLSMFYNAQGLIAKAEEMGARAGAAPPPPDEDG